MAYSWTTGGDLEIGLIAKGGYGEVHKVLSNLVQEKPLTFRCDERMDRYDEF